MHFHTAECVGFPSHHDTIHFELHTTIQANIVISMYRILHILNTVPSEQALENSTAESRRSSVVNR